jgi:hypothetical protein
VPFDSHVAILAPTFAPPILEDEIFGCVAHRHHSMVHRFRRALVVVVDALRVQLERLWRRIDTNSHRPHLVDSGAQRHFVFGRQDCPRTDVGHHHVLAELATSMGRRVRIVFVPHDPTGIFQILEGNTQRPTLTSLVARRRAAVDDLLPAEWHHSADPAENLSHDRVRDAVSVAGTAGLLILMVGDETLLTPVPAVRDGFVVDIERHEALAVQSGVELTFAQSHKLLPVFVVRLEFWRKI